MEIDATVVTSVVGFMTSCVVGARYLMTYWFKKTEQNELLKFQLTEKSIEALKLMIENHQIILKTHSEKITYHSEKMIALTGASIKDREATEALTVRVREYVESTERKFKQIESQILVGKDTTMFKTTKDKNAKTDR